MGGTVCHSVFVCGCMHILGIGTSLRQISCYDMGMQVDKCAQGSQYYVYLKNGPSFLRYR